MKPQLKDKLLLSFAYTVGAIYLAVLIYKLIII